MSYLQNELGKISPEAWRRYFQWRRKRPQGPSIISLRRPISRIPKSILEHREATIKRGRIVTTPIKSKAVPVIVETWRRPLNQWEAIPQLVSVGMKIFGDGGTKGQKKAASQARRSARAQKALTLLVPFSDLIDNNRWAQIASAFERAMQSGVNGTNIAGLIVRGTPYAFAKQSADVILATPPGAILDKRGGYPMWTGLQDAIRREISQRQPDIFEPGARPAPIYRPKSIPTPYRPMPVIPYTSPYLPTVPSYLPTVPPYQQPFPPSPQIITVPSPSFIQEQAPVKAAIDPTWLIMGGLGLFAFMMLQK